MSIMEQKMQEQIEVGLMASEEYALYCQDCIYLEPKESEQTTAHEPHWCNLFNVRIYHGMAHPELLRIRACTDDDKNPQPPRRRRDRCHSGSSVL